MTEVQELLARALTELPGGPVVPPLGLSSLGERRRVRRRHVRVGLALLAVMGVGGMAALVATEGPVRLARPAHGPEGPCAGVLGSGSASEGTRPRHTADEVLQGLDRQARAIGTYAPSLATLGTATERVVWNVDELGAASGSSLEVVRTTVADDTLEVLSRRSCPLPPHLRGATVNPASFNDMVDRPPAPIVATSAVKELSRGQTSLPWFLGQERDGYLELRLPAVCQVSSQVQVEEGSTYVLVQVVEEPRSSQMSCLSVLARVRLKLRSALGGRLVLHAVVDQSLAAAGRVPTALPVGTTITSDLIASGVRTRIWRLADGRDLTLQVGALPPAGGTPHDTWVAGFQAHSVYVDGCPGLRWDEQGLPFDLRLSQRAETLADTDGRLLLRVAESLYTQEYFGLTVDEARALASSYGLAFRVVRKDGRDLGRTADLKYRRVNVAVDAGRVTAVESYG